MRKIAPEVEELMWTLAEHRDPDAIDEFGQRYPDLRGELGKRLALTTSLVGARITGSSEIPRFRPKALPPPIWTRPAAIAGAGVALACLAFGSYYLTSALATPRVSERPPVVIQQQPDAPREAQDRGGPKVLPDGRLPQGGAAPGTTAGSIAELPKHLRPQTLSIKSGRFQDVIALLGQYCGLQIEMPDMPAELADALVEASYQDMAPIAMLEDLGAKHGFSAFYEGGNKILLVPARPSSELNADTGQ